MARFRDDSLAEMKRKLDSSNPRELLRTATEMQVQGNEHFRLGHDTLAHKAYMAATEMVMMAIQTIGKEDDDLFLLLNDLNVNMAATSIQLGYYERAVTHAEQVLALDSHNQKALFCAGRAHYELRQYAEARDFFSQAADVNPTSTETIRELSRCQERLAEEQNGIDVYKIYQMRKQKPKDSLDVADFQGPIKVAEIPGKGRGYIALEDIPPGKQILVCKAISVSFDSFGAAGQLEAVKALAEKVAKNPKVFGRAVFDLTSGDPEIDSRHFDVDQPGEVDDVPMGANPSDMERLSQIQATNAFGLTPGSKIGSGLFVAGSYLNHSCLPNACDSSYNVPMGADPPDMERLSHIQATNAFGQTPGSKIGSGLFVAGSYLNHSCLPNACDSSYNVPMGADPPDMERLSHIQATNAFGLTPGSKIGSGLFVAASYFNNSCLPNACDSSYNDIMVVHAVKPIKRGDEVTISYYDCSWPSYRERQNYFQRFVCSCELCRLDLSEPTATMTLRDQLNMEEFTLMRSYVSVSESSANKLAVTAAPTPGVMQQQLAFIQRLEKTYSNGDRPRSDLQQSLFSPYMKRVLFNPPDEDSLMWVKRAFRALGVDYEHLLQCARNGDNNIFQENSMPSRQLATLLRDFIELADDDDEAAQARLALKHLLRVMEGSNAEMVAEEFGLKK
ncbi:hypothetical protein BV898_09336 [Hypsibius exemplaris]|uniref:SET domain-containing protein n=1 Tax=Hypsibius exemplaris TaxID=2072580 RepID=A0A1W0WMW0_HYPEX|nr:hypothetical protein BV898_09336 [Hypsibius exemplaris]